MTTTTTLRVSPANIGPTRARFAKINARAARRGFAGRLTLEISEAITKTTTDEHGFQVTEVFHEVTIGGDPPCYEGWELIARVEATVSGVPIVQAAPGVDDITADQLRPGECDHCRHDRRRKHTYLVREQATGRTLSVGSTCLNDFLGWQGRITWVSPDQAEHDLTDRTAVVDEAWTVETILGYAWAATMAYGYVRASDHGIGRTPTKEVVTEALAGTSTAAGHLREELADYAAPAAAKAAEVRAFILSDAFDGASSYVHNLKALAAEDAATLRHVGLLASAPAVWIRHRERQTEQKPAQATSTHLGAVGERLTLTATITAIRTIPGTYGTTWLYLLRTADGDVVKWFASRDALGQAEDTTVTVTATVKDHDTYHGIKQTVITRARRHTPEPANAA